MEWLTDWGVWHWLILGFVLLIAEILVPGVFLLWWGLSAIVIAVITKLIPTLPLSFLAVMYALIASILSIIWWRYQYGKDQIDQAQSALNQRDHAMIGAQGKVLEIGENGIGNRDAICNGLEYLGTRIDPERNNVRGKEAEISAEGSKVKIFAIPTNEEIMIARDTKRITSPLVMKNW